MESFFQAALNSVLEAAGGGSRSSRTSGASSSAGHTGSTRANNRSSTSGGVSSRSSGSASGSSGSTERVTTTPTSSGNPRAAQGSRSERTSGTQPRHADADQSGQASKTGSSNTVPAAGEAGSSNSSSAKGVSAPGNSHDPVTNPQVRDREAADRLKDLGNESFRRGMYGLAAEYYSKAIAVDATVASYFTNRALCHKREKRYLEALEDAESALALEETNVKGLYIKGDALVQLGDYDAGVNLLEKAQTASSSQAGRAANEIRHSLLNAKKLRNALWRRQRSVDRKDLEKFLKECIEAAAEQGRLPKEEVSGRLAQLEHLVAEADATDAPFEIPDFLTCKISMGLMDEPVVTPSGITYEHKLLLEHLNRNGPTDPLTSGSRKGGLVALRIAVVFREPCDPKRLVPNYAVKEATAWFLERQV